MAQKNLGGLSETPASGNREYMQKVVQNVKDRLGHNEGVSEVSMDSEKMHISIWTLFMGFMDAGGIEHGSELREEFENIQEF